MSDLAAPATAGTRPPRRAAAALVALLPVLVLCSRPDSVAALVDPGSAGTAAQDPAPQQLGPRLRLRLSGNLEGRLEPCGCASGQLGGLARRAFYLQLDPDYDLLIEGGNLVTGGTPLDAQKLEAALAVLDMRGYQVLGLGARDFDLPIEDLAMYLGGYRMVAVASDLVEKAPAEGGEAFPTKVFYDHDGTPKARVASLVLHLPDGPAKDRFTLLPPQEAWQRAMEGSGDRLRLLLVHGTGEEVRAAAAYTPKPDLVIGVSNAFPEPPHAAEEVGGVPVVFTGVRGRMLLDVALARRAGDGVPILPRYEVIALAGSKTAPGAGEDRAARGLILEHRQQVKEMGLREAMAGQEPLPEGRRYVGSAACADCHEEAYEVYRKSKHAHAWATLEEAEKGTRYGWPVTAYPDCVACHVVGYGKVSGFVNPEQTPDLKDVGCEACHGPASHHIEAYEGKRPEAEGRMGKVEPRTCLHCHDFEQSPTFVYGERWKVIEHR